MVSRIEQRCIDKNMKMTDQRRVIARVLSESADHPDVEEVYRRATAIDPHISIANAELQATRVAKARNLSLEIVLSVIRDNTDSADFGILGEPGVNVLALNLALDQLK